VVAQTNSDAAGEPVQTEADGKTGPAEQGGHKRRNRADVDTNQEESDHPVDIGRPQLITVECRYESVCFGLVFQTPDFRRGQAAGM